MRPRCWAASFVTLNVQRSNSLFDVGQPLWFQISSLPKRKRLSLPTPTKGDLVILSHWDWDHFSHGREHKAFHQVPWVAPAQIVGPGAYYFAEKLHGNGMLNLVRDSRRYRPKNGSLHLYSCPFSASDRNSSGIIAVAHLSRGNSVLLTGDCDYDTINRRSLPTATYSTIIIPHHGGELPGTPPPISANGRFIVSYGLPNKYGHPKPSVISQHAVIRSALEGTADNLQPQIPLMKCQARGSRDL